MNRRKAFLVWPILIFFFGAVAFTVGCRRLPSRFAKELAGVCPNGWQVSANSNVITLRREAAVWIMGKVSNPPRSQDESDQDYFKRVGREIHYEVRLRFVPLLPRAEYEKLRAARAEAAARLNQGASGKAEYSQWQKQYEECQVPPFFTKDYSIFVDRWADGGGIAGHRIEPRFIQVYPADAAVEIEGVIEGLSRVLFRECEALSSIARNSSPEEAWRGLLSAMQKGQISKMRNFATDRGLASLRAAVGERDIPNSFRGLGVTWSGWTVRWRMVTDSNAFATFGWEIKEHGLEFIHTSEGWRLDNWRQGYF